MKILPHFRLGSFSSSVIALIAILAVHTESVSAQVEQAWVARYNGPGNEIIEPSALAVDAAGNLYVTGAYFGGRSRDYATIKYDPSGIELWAARYNGPGNDYDYAIAIAVDTAGNIYVTGTSKGTGTFYDYTTIKYDASGHELWVARYNGPSNGEDRATALAVDDEGNVYVTGYSSGLNTGMDYATIKYDPSGIELWAARYDGPNNGDDRAIALAVGVSGNIHVTGTSYGSENYSSADYVTIQYDASGNALWVARYNNSGDSHDGATALAVDAAGNVYVTGSTNAWDPVRYSYIDYHTIKYDASGNMLWVARYDGLGFFDESPTALALDGAGNVYLSVTIYGGTPTSYDYATVKYDTNGNELWEARFNGPGHDDHPIALAVDAAGGVYVTGSTGYGDYATIKYDANGNEIWVARYDGLSNGVDRAIALGVDAAGNVYVTGGSSIYYTGPVEYATIKYDASGNELWVARNGSGNYHDYVSGLAVDAGGNVYVTGYGTGTGTAEDYVTIKYDANGNQLWVARFNGPGNYQDIAHDLAVDASGNVYVTGSSYGTETSADYATIKYDAVGNQLWVARFNGQGIFFDKAVDLALDAGGNVYVTGSSGGWNPMVNQYTSEYATIKYDSSGNELWVARYNGPAWWAGQNVPSALAVDAAGNVYVTGTTSASDLRADWTSGYLTIKYDASGREVWVAHYDPPLDDISYTLAVDVAGNVYVTGRSVGAGVSIYDYATIKYDAGGNQVWVARYNGPGNGQDIVAALAVDASGNVYVTGSSYGTDSASDYATIKYDTDGNELWVARYNGPDKGHDGSSALALDDEGNVYVTGFSTGVDTALDYATIKYDATGNELWVERYNGPDNGIDKALAVAVDASGNVYVTGSITGTDLSLDYATVKLVPTSNGGGGVSNSGGGGGGSCFINSISN